MMQIRNLILVLGDQLDLDAPMIQSIDAGRDVVWMAEVDEESEAVWSHKQRIVLFLSAMRHFAEALRDQGISVDYRELDAVGGASFSSALKESLQSLRPEAVHLTRPGSHAALQSIEAVCREVNVSFKLLEDSHFFTTPADFKDFASSRKSLRMEYFYRGLRKRFDILMEGEKPVGGQWNFDKENRKAFPKSGPQSPYSGHRRAVDAITETVTAQVGIRFADHPGSLENFSWAVTREQALDDLDSFIKKRLPYFGDHQDAMWRDEPWLFHSLLSASLNLKLLNPREVIAAAVSAYEDGYAPLAAVEGFIRQILGWREYVRGIYWTHMPEYLEMNAMGASAELPDFFWNGDTEYECLRQSIGQTLKHGYAHHIQRLMVTGLYALLIGVHPKRVHEWYLAIYVDAVEWVELPNVLGMSQFADGGLMASKPYVATGKYIQRMSNYCQACPKNPEKRTGEDACPFTTLYWDYLIRHKSHLKGNQRMQLQLRNLNNLADEERVAILEAAEGIKEKNRVEGVRVSNE